MTWAELKEKLQLMGIRDTDYITEINLAEGNEYIFIHAKTRGALAINRNQGWEIREIHITSTPERDMATVSNTKETQEQPIRRRRRRVKSEKVISIAQGGDDQGPGPGE